MRMFKSLRAVFRKELIQLLRDPLTLAMMFGIPSLQLIIFGYAINTDVTNIPTAILDLDRGIEARRLVEAIENTGTFAVEGYIQSYEELDVSMRRGEVQVAVIIPSDFTADIQSFEPTQVLFRIDGSNATIATTAMQAATNLGLQKSLATLDDRMMQLGVAISGELEPTLEARPRLIYNPDLKSSHFYVPGLIGVVLQIIPVFLTAFAIVKERESGTLEQLLVTPLEKSALIIGKLIPFLLVGFVDFAFVVVVMVGLFTVPIKGSLLLLVALSTIFIFCALAIGLLISTVARSQAQAMQMAYVVMLPSILLSGFVFPRESMPLILQYLSLTLPVTYYLEILRGIILRGAIFPDLIDETLVLLAMMFVLLFLSINNFRKTLE